MMVNSDLVVISWWFFMDESKKMDDLGLVMGVPQGRWMVFVNGKMKSFEMDDWG